MVVIDLLVVANIDLFVVAHLSRHTLFPLPIPIHNLTLTLPGPPPILIIPIKRPNRPGNTHLPNLPLKLPQTDIPLLERRIIQFTHLHILHNQLLTLIVNTLTTQRRPFLEVAKGLALVAHPVAPLRALEHVVPV